MVGNVVVGQSGGPTSVINSSLAGVYKTAKTHRCGHRSHLTSTYRTHKKGCRICRLALRQPLIYCT